MKGLDGVHEDVGLAAVQDAGEPHVLFSTRHLADELVRPHQDARLVVHVGSAVGGDEGVDRVLGRGPAGLLQGPGASVPVVGGPPRVQHRVQRAWENQRERYN